MLPLEEDQPINKSSQIKSILKNDLSHKRKHSQKLKSHLKNDSLTKKNKAEPKSPGS